MTNFEKIDRFLNHRLSRHRKEDTASPDLPVGAVRFREPITDRLLGLSQIRGIRYYLRTRISADERARIDALEQSVKTMGYTFTENTYPEFLTLKTDNSPLLIDQPHPKVEGYDWYRGYTIEIPNRGRVHLFTGWMQPWLPSGAPDPIVYTTGNPPKDQVIEIIRSYTGTDPNPR